MVKLQWKANTNSHAIYRMVPFPMTLSDPDLDSKVTIFERQMTRKWYTIASYKGD